MKTLSPAIFVFAILFISPFLFLIPSLSFSQDKYYDLMEELYYDRQPSPRAEAMGRGLAADNQNDFGAFYNPTLTSLQQGLKVNISTSDKYIGYENAKYSFLNIAYNLKKIGSFGFSKYGLKYDKIYYTGNGSFVDKDLHHSIYTINYSREIFKDFFAGININSVTPNYQTPAGLLSRTEYPIDIGILKRFKFLDSVNNISHIVHFGGSLYNLNEVEFKYTPIVGVGPFDYYLPRILRFAASYNITFQKNKFIKDLNLLSVLAHLEMENTLNDETRQSVKMGGELTFMDILSLRAGYFILNDRIGSIVNHEVVPKKDRFTYGGGVRIPVDIIFNFKTPASINIDYVKLQPVEFNFDYEGENFESIAVKLNYVPNF